jgi:glycosyltransferase involved in cell wall biosynthesis
MIELEAQTNHSTKCSSLRTLQLGMGWFPEEAGGLNRFYYDCIHALPKVGIASDGLVVGSAQIHQQANGKVQSFALPDASLWHRWQGVRQFTQKLIADQDYSLIASHFALYALPILDQLGDRPLVTHFHGPWAMEVEVEGGRGFANTVKRAIEHLVYWKSTQFIVLSDAFRTLLHQHYRVPLERIHLIPGGVEIESFDLGLSREEARIKLNWPLDRPIIVAARRLAKRMGLENLIHAMQILRNHQPDVLLLIAGKGALCATLQQQIEDLELTNHVRLLGYVPDRKLAMAYRAADFTIVPTVALEGFGLIVIESLAAGTPVLGTPVGGIPEILRPLSNDLVLPGSSSHQLATGILDALSGQRYLPSDTDCQAYVQKHYTWTVIAQQIKAVYETALSC